LHIGLNCSDAVSDQSGGHHELVPSTAGNVDKSAFFREALRHRQSDAAAAARDNR
jgi:hypothetical protein